MTTTVQDLFSTIYLLEEVIESSKLESKPEYTYLEESDIYEALVEIAQDYDEEEEEDEEVDIDPTDIITYIIDIDSYDRLSGYCDFLKEFVRELDALDRVQIEFDEYCRMYQNGNYEYALACIDNSFSIFDEEDRIVIYSFCDLLSKENPHNGDDDEAHDYMIDHAEDLAREFTETQYDIYCENGFDLNINIDVLTELVFDRIVEKHRDAYMADLEAGKIVIPKILL